MGNQNSINQVFLVGRLAREVELTTATIGGTARDFARFTVVTTEVYYNYKTKRTIKKTE